MLRRFEVPTVVADTTKVRIFKQITTQSSRTVRDASLLLIPQRYEFSSKSQPPYRVSQSRPVVADTTKVRIFKQITTFYKAWYDKYLLLLIPQRYEFSSKSQPFGYEGTYIVVVADTTKVRIFKQITTNVAPCITCLRLLLIPQRYEFSSKSQPKKYLHRKVCRCC